MKTKFAVLALAVISAVSVSASPNDYKVVSYESHSNLTSGTGCNVVFENQTSRVYAESFHPCGGEFGLYAPVNLGDLADIASGWVYTHPLHTLGRALKIHRAELK